ncbi:MAG: AMP-binding protein [Planctomycetota bacterium]|nr:AMP-binding protein [Planctomycetota bacterium]
MQILTRILRRFLFSPMRVAVVDDQKSWKGIELYIGALHLAKAINKASDRPNIGVLLPTSGLFPMALAAIWKLGKTIVPLNYLLSREELEYIIADSELDLVVTVGPMLEHLGNMPEGVAELKLDEMSFKGFPPLRGTKHQPEDFVAVLLYTSGTSGKPKGVMLTAANLLANVDQCTEWAEFTKADSILGVLPQFHSFGFTILTLLPLSIGCKATYTARFNPRKLLTLMRTHKPTAFIAIPSMYNAMLSAKSAEPDDFKSFRLLVAGGEPLPEAVAMGYQEKFGVTINEGYGLTETAPGTNICIPRIYKPKSVGPPLPRIEEKIVDGEGKRLGVDEEGEICIKGPNIMKGYFKLPEETAKVFDDEGFFRTGDMGRMDSDGHLFITGRIKEMLIIGGENVFPREIEEVLDSHPSVHASAVIGMMDESRGEVALAFVEIEEDAEFDAKELRAHCRKSLGQHKVPREVRMLKELPRNPTGKIMRRKLNAETTSDE